MSQTTRTTMKVPTMPSVPNVTEWANTVHLKQCASQTRKPSVLLPTTKSSTAWTRTARSMVSRISHPGPRIAMVNYIPMKKDPIWWMIMETSCDFLVRLVFWFTTMISAVHVTNFFSIRNSPTKISRTIHSTIVPWSTPSQHSGKSLAWSATNYAVVRRERELRRNAMMSWPFLFFSRSTKPGIMIFFSTRYQESGGVCLFLKNILPFVYFVLSLLYFSFLFCLNLTFTFWLDFLMFRLTRLARLFDKRVDRLCI